MQNSKAPAQPGTRLEPDFGSVSQRTEHNLRPLYCRDAAMKYNRPADKQRRLRKIRLHKSVRGKVSYCSLCSYSFTLKLNGRVIKKRGGRGQKQRFETCRQCICAECWTAWHTSDTLQKATIPAVELEKLKKRALDISTDGE